MSMNNPKPDDTTEYLYLVTFNYSTRKWQLNLDMQDRLIDGEKFDYNTGLAEPATEPEQYNALAETLGELVLTLNNSQF